jgi:hypothetical protein
VQTVIVKQGQSFKQHQPIVPNRWHGQVDCVIGPFSSQHVAEYYAKVVVDFGQFEISQRIFANGDSWYIEAESLRERTKTINFQIERKL